MLQPYSEITESEIDQLAFERRERQLHRPPPAPSRKDAEQDIRLRTLERENRRLQCYMTALVEIMKTAGIISERQIDAIVAEAEWAKLQEPTKSANSSLKTRDHA